MARDDDDDLYDEEFDFVDEDDEQSDLEEATDSADAEGDQTEDRSSTEEEEAVDEYGRPEPTANYVVHVYEHKKFTRTIDRAFTPEDAEAFATEYNRTSKPYSRLAVAGKNDAKPKKTLE